MKDANTTDLETYKKLKKKLIKTRTRGVQTDIVEESSENNEKENGKDQDKDKAELEQPRITLLLTTQGLTRGGSGYGCGYDDYGYDDDEYTDEDEEDSVSKSKRSYSKLDKKYYGDLPKKKQKIVDKTEKELAEINNQKVPLRFKIIDSNMDTKLKAFAMQKVDQLANMRTTDNEYFKLQNYIESLSKIPVGKYKNLPITNKNKIEEIKTFLDETRERLDATVYGHKETKDQIILLLAKWISNPMAGGLVIGIQGDPGTGKTLFASKIAENLKMPMAFISLGTCSCSTDMVGSSYVYEGSRWGKLVSEVMRAGIMNPILFFDELDQISPTKHGDEITNTLIHLTDSTQNTKFHDRYFADLDLDFSKSLMIFSYNKEDMVNPILKDRMVTVNVRGYTSKEKVKIAQDYLLPKMLKEFGFPEKSIEFGDEVVRHMTHLVEEEQGVRNLKRALENIVSQLNLERILKKEMEFPVKVTLELVDKYVSKKESQLKVPSMYM